MAPTIYLYFKTLSKLITEGDVISPKKLDWRILTHYMLAFGYCAVEDGHCDLIGAGVNMFANSLHSSDTPVISYCLHSLPAGICLILSDINQTSKLPTSVRSATMFSFP